MVRPFPRARAASWAALIISWGVSILWELAIGVYALPPPPFLVLNQSHIGRLVRDRRIIGLEKNAGVYGACGCTKNYSAAWDADGELLAVVVDGIFCEPYARALRKSVLDDSVWQWETPIDAWRRVHKVWGAVQGDKFKYRGYFPGLTASTKDPEMQQRVLLDVRRCLHDVMAETTIPNAFGACRGVDQDQDPTCGLEPIADQPVHTGDIDLYNPLIPRFGFAATASSDAHELLPIQSAPHTDNGVGLASVLTLATDQKFEQSGTVLMQQKGTGVTHVWTAKAKDVVSLADRRAQRAALERDESPHNGWLNTSQNRFATGILNIPNKFNRIALYPMARLHNAFLPADQFLSDAPAEGRLTLNSFWELHAFAGVSERSYFCEERVYVKRNSNEATEGQSMMAHRCALCIAWRECAWHTLTGTCMTSYTNATSSSSSPQMMRANADENQEEDDDEDEDGEMLRSGDEEMCRSVHPMSTRSLVNKRPLKRGRRTEDVALVEVAGLGRAKRIASEPNPLSPQEPRRDTEITPENEIDEVVKKEEAGVSADGDGANKPFEETAYLLHVAADQLLSLGSFALRPASYARYSELETTDLLVSWMNHQRKYGLNLERSVLHQDLVNSLTKDILLKIFRLFRRSPAAWQWRDPDGKSLLHQAVLLGTKRVVSFLLKAGLNPGARDAFGRSSMDLAASQGYLLDLQQRTLLPASSVELRTMMRSSVFSRSSNSPSIKPGGGGAFPSGGWDPEDIFQGDSVCEVRVVRAKDIGYDTERFLTELVTHRQPVLIRRGVFDDPETWPAVHEWTRSKIMAVFGMGYVYFNELMPPTSSDGDIPYEPGAYNFAKHLADSDAWVRQQHFAGNDTSATSLPPPYWCQSFSRRSVNATKEDAVFHTYLSDDIRVPVVFRDTAGSLFKYRTRKQEFLHGARSSGSPIHAHGASWSALIHGKKVWYLKPPSRAEFSDTQHSPPAVEMAAQFEELRRALPSEAPLKCVQEAGDIMITPKLWSHAVVNAKESISVTTHFALQTLRALQAAEVAEVRATQFDDKDKDENYYYKGYQADGEERVAEVFAF